MPVLCTLVFNHSFSVYLVKLIRFTLINTYYIVFQDTDSIFATVKKGEKFPYPEDDDKLGSLASELRPGEYVTDWICLGPKNYAYKTSEGETSVHIRGFTMSLNDCQDKLNFQSMKKLLIDTVINNEEGVITTANQYKIKRQKIKRQLLTVNEERNYKFKYVKQRIVKEHLSVEPYGYCPSAE